VKLQGLDGRNRHIHCYRAEACEVLKYLLALRRPRAADDPQLRVAVPRAHLSAVGGQKIGRLLPEHIEDGYAAMLGDGLSAGSVRKIHAILSSAYEIEVKRGNVARNPCRLVEAPRLG
jgi:hypothetical protein